MHKAVTKILQGSVAAQAMLDGLTSYPLEVLPWILNLTGKSGELNKSSKL